MIFFSFKHSRPLALSCQSLILLAHALHSNMVCKEDALCKAGVGNVDPGGPVSLQFLAPTLIKRT